MTKRAAERPPRVTARSRPSLGQVVEAKPEVAIGNLLELEPDRRDTTPNWDLRGRSPQGDTVQPTKDGSASRVGFVSTYPPTACGLASFTASLRTAMADNRGTHEGLGVVRVSDGDDLNTSSSGDPVVATMNPTDRKSISEAARHLRGFDAVILQHEYGIYGPNNGKAVIDLADAIEPPLITTLHTVLAEPRPVQQRIVERLAHTSARIVVPTRSAQQVLYQRYRVDPALVSVIPHGTHPIDMAQCGSAALARGEAGSRPTLVTWGLLGPGKGLEWALLAMNLARHRIPELRYVVAGRTHPKVASTDGEAYRLALEDMVARLDLGDVVDFVDDYLPREELEELLHEADAVVLPYESTEQVVSGVLAEAVAAGVPTIATTFPHAVELAEEGAVRVVPPRDPQALATSIVELLNSSGTRERMVSAQQRLAPDLSWASVAVRYEELIGSVVRLRAEA